MTLINSLLEMRHDNVVINRIRSLISVQKLKILMTDTYKEYKNFYGKTYNPESLYHFLGDPS
jgi:hypothetical protein